MKECVIIDGVRTANVRAHAEKGWLRNMRPDDLLGIVYQEIFKRNPKVRPEEVEAVFCGCANITHMQNDIGRLAWLAAGMPDSVPSNTITQQCPSGMAAVEHAARAIMCGEGDIYIASGSEDMEKVPMAMHMDFSPKLGERYNLMEIPMGMTAEKVAKEWKISRVDQENMAFHSHQKADAATKAGKFKNEIIPVSILLKGEFGLHDVCLGVPCLINKHGADKIIKIGLTASEKKQLKKSSQVFKECMI